ncbi:MAG: hypothetical protein ACLFUZ_02330 [Candidatus Micrarchaeia archaeon]
MRVLILLMIFGLILGGCTGSQDVPAGGETQEMPPAPQETGDAESGEETAPAEQAEEEETPAASEEPEADEEELVHWGVGVEEEIDETHRKLQAVEFDGYLLIVDDITDDKPYPCAAVRVGEQTDTYVRTLFQDKVCPGESTYWNSPEGDEYRIKVFETAAGYAGYAYWADVAVYKQG